MNLTGIILAECGSPKKASFAEEIFNIGNKNFKKVGELLMLIGTILEEYTEDSTYIVSLRVHCYLAIAAITVESGTAKLIVCAREGLINQKTAQKAANKIREHIGYNG